MSQTDEFTAWLRQVQTAAFAQSFAHLRDLPTEPYRDWFAAGYPPEAAANAALEAAGFEFVDGEGMSSDDFDAFYEALYAD